MPSESVDLIVTDPPYGQDIVGSDKTVGGGNATKPTNYGRCLWDKKRPSQIVFNEIFRVSKNQIIFGANHFFLPISTGWIVWDKGRRNTDFSDAELIWTSFHVPLRVFRHVWDGMRQENMRTKENRVHPTQKPLRLLQYLITSFSKESEVILDPFLGSGTTAVACKQLNRNFIGIEINPDYCKIAEKRLASIPKRLDKLLETE